MPISGAENLRSAGGVGFHPLGPNVTPINPLDLESFQQAAWGYSGVPTPDAPIAPVTRRQRHWVYRRKSGTRRIRAYKRGD